MDESVVEANRRIGEVVAEVRRIFEQVALAFRTLDRLMGEQQPRWTCPFGSGVVGAGSRSLQSPRDWLPGCLARAWVPATEAEAWSTAIAVSIEPHDSDHDDIEPCVTAGVLRLAEPGAVKRFEHGWIWYVFDGADTMPGLGPLHRKEPGEPFAKEWVVYSFPLAALTGAQALESLVMGPCLALADGDPERACGLLNIAGVAPG